MLDIGFIALLKPIASSLMALAGMAAGMALAGNTALLPCIRNREASLLPFCSEYLSSALLTIYHHNHILAYWQNQDFKTI